MTAFSQLSDRDFGAAALRLFPRGHAWAYQAGSMLVSFSKAIGDCLFQLHAAEVDFLEVESNPATAVQLLPDFMADYGLPDSCSPAVQTVAEQRASLLAKIASIGGQSEAYFIGVAAALGYAITITTWRPFQFGSPFGRPLVNGQWRFAWQVNAPSITVRRFTLGVSAFREPFWTIGNTELQCRLGKIAPAYGVLWFNYSGS